MECHYLDIGESYNSVVGFRSSDYKRLNPDIAL